MQASLSAVGLALLAALPMAAGHGLITSPHTRHPGAATAAVCGEPLVQFYQRDNTSYPEALMRSSGWDKGMDKAKCNQYLCKGFVFADNKDGVQAYQPGQVVPIDVSIRIPHLGFANVSVVDAVANTLIGAPLIEWKKGYADGASAIPHDQLHFNVTVPTNLPARCSEPGNCVSLCCFLLPLNSIHPTYGLRRELRTSGFILLMTRNSSSSGTGWDRAKHTSPVLTLLFRLRLSRSGRGRHSRGPALFVNQREMEVSVLSPSLRNCKESVGQRGHLDHDRQVT